MADQTAGDGYPVRRVVAFPLTSARDGHEHLVGEDAMAAGKAGHFTTLCGRAVWSTALACPPGPRCRDCVAIRNADATGRLRHRRASQRRMWTLKAWLHRHSGARHLMLRKREVPARTDKTPHGE